MKSLLHLHPAVVLVCIAVCFSCRAMGQEKLPEKQLVFFAGPHRASEEGVEDFFHHWLTSGWRRGHPNELALRYWRWPTPENDEYGPSVFGELVKQHSNATLVTDILVSIQNFWTEAENGVVVGTEYFDQVGRNAKYDGLTPMNSIQAKLGVEDADVTVILNYRTPRIEQWLSIWNSNDPDLTYSEFMCNSYGDPDLKKERLSQLSASMNGLNAAYEFLRRGWKVKLIDLEGVKETKRDVTHVIGCDILKGKCTDGFLFKHSKYQTPDEEVPDIGRDVGENEARKVEEIFQFRDCGYQELMKEFLDSSQLEVLYEYSIWTQCDPGQSEVYKNLANGDDIVYTAILSQVDCSAQGINIPDGIVSMDEALTMTGNVNHGEHKGGDTEGFLNNIVVPLVFIAGIGYVAFFMYKKRQKEFNLSQAAVGGDHLQDAVIDMQKTTMSRHIS